MESRNPVFNRSDAFSRRGYATFRETPPATAGQLEEMYAAPSATGDTLPASSASRRRPIAHSSAMFGAWRHRSSAGVMLW